MEKQGIGARILTFLDGHQWISFILAVAVILITTYLALRFGHGINSLIGTIIH